MHTYHTCSPKADHRIPTPRRETSASALKEQMTTAARVAFAASRGLSLRTSGRTSFTQNSSSRAPLARPLRHRVRFAPRAQQEGAGEDPVEDSPDSSEETPGAGARRARRDAGEDASALISRLAAIPAEVDEASFRPDTKAATTVASAPTLLLYTFTVLPGTLIRNSEEYLAHPVRLLVASAIAILFGFFAATSAATIIGSVADWDPLAAAVLLIWTESFTRAYYRREKRSRLLQLANAFKIGLIYGMAVDAFKLST